MLKCSPEALPSVLLGHSAGIRTKLLSLKNSDCDLFNRSVVDSPLTNADAIRCMSDDDLAVFLFTVQKNALVLCGVTPPAYIQPPLSWLKQPMENPNVRSSDVNGNVFLSKSLAVPAASNRNCYECAYCHHGKYLKSEPFCLHPSWRPDGFQDDNCFVKRGSKEVF